MKKRTGKMISLSLAVAMAVTAAPVTALADENTQSNVIETSELTPAQSAGETGTGTTTEGDETGTGTTTEGDETGTGTTTEGDETEAGKEVTSMVPLTSTTPVDEQSTETTLKSTETVGTAEELTNALKNAKDDEETTITLSDNIEGDFTVAENKNIVLDLNGFKITNTSNHTITNNGRLTIKDSSEGKTGTIDNVSHARAAVWNNGIAILEGGTYTRSLENGIDEGNSGGNSYYNIVNHNHMTIKSGVTVKQDGNFSSMIENGWYDGNQNKDKESSVMIIEGGTFSGGLNTVKNDDYGELTINDGTFSNISQAAFLNWNTATINGGNFEVNDNAEAVILNGYGNATMDKGELTINDGNFNTKQNDVNFIETMYTKDGYTSGTIEVNGGNIYGDIQLSDVTAGATLSIANGVTINGNITNGGVANVDVTDATVTGSVSNAGTGSVVISDGATVEGAVSNTGSGSMAVIESKVGGYSPEQTITFVDSTTTNGETIENTQDVSAACARIGAKYYNTLEKALTESNSGDTITLVKDVTVSNTQDMANSNYNEAVITLKDGVTLDGDTHTIYADKNWFNSTAGKNTGKPANHIVGVSGVSATIKNLTIVGNANTKHGINAFGTNGTNTLIVNNVTIKNCGTAGMVINGAKVTATNINTEGNAWGAINVDKSTGSTLDLTGGTFKEAAQIWTEADGTNVTLDGVQLDKVTGIGTYFLKGYTYFTDDVSKLGAAYNETTKTIYESLAEALTAAQSGNTISVVKDTELTTDAAVAEGVTLVVNPGVTLSIADNATLTNSGTIENKGEIDGKVEHGTTGEVTEYYTVTFTSNKEIESVEVKDENGDTVEPNVEGKFVYSLKDGKYTYTMETVRGTRTGSFTVAGEELTINERFSSGGSSHSYDGYITIINPKNGDVSVSDDWAYEDDKITLTITPDDGYEVDKIEIVDDEGDKIDAKKVDDEDNKYTFRMANCDVTVTVTFKEEGKTTEDTDKEEDKDDEETTELNFTDVKETDWFFKGVEYVVDKGIMSGVSENEFAPSGKLTRAMLVQMLYNMESRPACDAENAFMDVPVGQWYTDAVIWANDAKIVSGMGEGLFAPNMEITREQMVAMLYNYAKYRGYDVTASADLSAFADTASVSAWAQPAMQWAVAEGYISGMGDSQLAPQGTATRAEIASVIMRFMEATAETEE
ncbi:S-layer homology domain-containing protein [Anaerotignum lactatifermentans]|uniref:S-layer homology domain-containing protein n=1 Tax=Anaerotignum lactatifermentans TaxID=160404 RepID=UPI00174A5D42|nr:S-layer homology domain-containing protein [Anaerotignum lactatifermentans]